MTNSAEGHQECPAERITASAPTTLMDPDETSGIQAGPFVGTCPHDQHIWEGFCQHCLREFLEGERSAR